jgi:hypothetical protein
MKTLSLAVLAVVFLSLNLNAQTKTNTDIEQQMRTLGAEKNIELTFDSGSNMSKLMAVSENFSDAEVSRANVRAMNFAIGFFYPGQTLERAPDPILLTFWVLSKKPQFGADHFMTLFIADETIEIGDSRYVARARDNMEYLNFNLSRDVLMKIAKNSNVRFRLGTAEFKFTSGQLRMIANLMLLSDPVSKQ